MAQARRGDIFCVDIPKKDIVGSEQYGFRPWLVISADIINTSLPIVVAVPLSSKIQKTNRHHRILIPESEIIHEPGTSKRLSECIALTEQVRVLDAARLGSVKVAHLSPAAVASVEAGLAYVLGLP